MVHEVALMNGLTTPMLCSVSNQFIRAIKRSPTVTPAVVFPFSNHFQSPYLLERNIQF
jgi:hypothetical protein